MLCWALVREPGDFSDVSLYKIEVFFLYSLFTSHGRGGVCINIGVVCYSSFSSSSSTSTSTSTSIRRGIVGRGLPALTSLLTCFISFVYLFFWLAGFGLGCFFFHFFFLCVVRLGRLGTRYYY